MLKLKLQYFDNLMWRADSFEKTLILGKVEGRRRRGRQRMDVITDRVWVDSGSWWWTGSPGVLWFMGSQRVGHDWMTELNWMFIHIVLQQKLTQWYKAIILQFQTFEQRKKDAKLISRISLDVTLSHDRHCWYEICEVFEWTENLLGLSQPEQTNPVVPFFLTSL